MIGRGDSGFNHVIGGLAAAGVLPCVVFGLDLPFWLGLVIAAGVYGGVAFLLAPRRAIDRIDADTVGRVQAELVATLVEEGEGSVERLRAAARRIRSKDAARRAAHMAEAARTMLDRLVMQPDKLPAVRRFLTYYLPRSAEVAEGLAIVEEQRVQDPTRLAQIEQVMIKLDEAFTFYADSFAKAQLDVLDVELKLLRRSLDDDLGTVPLPMPPIQSPDPVPHKGVS